MDPNRPVPYSSRSSSSSSFVKASNNKEGIQFGTSSIRSMIKQKSVKDLRLLGMPLNEKQHQKRGLYEAPIESEIEESLSKIELKEYEPS
jgi:hypothetical protein